MTGTFQSVPWLNSMPAPFPGGNPVTVEAANTGDMMLCLEGSLPTGFATTGTGSAQQPYTMLAVNLNASRGAIGSVLWQKDIQSSSRQHNSRIRRCRLANTHLGNDYDETIQWVGYSLNDGSLLWGPTTPETAFDYYGTPGVSVLAANLAYGNLYSSSFGGIMLLL